MIHNHHPPPSRRGFIIQEASVALILALALFAGLAQLMVMLAHQRRGTEQRLLAIHEVANVMEDVMSRPWAELTAETVGPVDLTTAVAAELQDANLEVQIRDDDESDGRRLIAVQLDWLQPNGTPARSVRLVAWKFRDLESEPTPRSEESR
jgi:hypothetical protein